MHLQDFGVLGISINFSILFYRELDGNVIDTMTAGAVKSIEMNLLFLLILEMNKPEVLQSIPDSAKLVRIFCVFLIG